jgi:octaheme c-type cytochrome (tetrathionate reductase family)
MSQKRHFLAAALLAAAFAFGNAWASAPAAPRKSTADHAKFKELQHKFASGPEVTKACLSCHTEAADQVQHTKHWTWEYTDPKTHKKLGKRAIINNYCTTTISNEKDCIACHAGYGWKDSTFDFQAQENVDCLVCHDSTGTYRKLPGFAGHPVYERTELPKGSGKFVEAVDLEVVAQKVGLPGRANCGACHFFGAGANGTKHGDLDNSLNSPSKALDVHMDAKGLNFSCVKCHETSGHQVAGSRYEMAAAVTGHARVRGETDDEPASCQSCHSDKPHHENPLLMERLNAHTEKLACQTCHIPEYARDAVGTEKSWDWSTATKMGPEGKPISVKDSAGHRAFDSKKGNWVWDSYLVPEYRWFNGQMTYKTIGDKIDASGIVEINHPEGKANDPASRIWPFKVHRGKQVYDTGNNYLIVAHTAGEDENALWQSYDWQKAITAGMKTAGLPYSGKYGFVSTEMSWPITHMVAPKDGALRCAQCHGDESRLAGIAGLYLPGFNHNGLVDSLGWAAAALALISVLIHGFTRICFFCNRKPKETEQ